jgi:hypothetical protein
LIQAAVSNQRVACFQCGKSGKIPVHRPEFSDSVVQAAGRDTGIMDPGTGDLRLDKKPGECLQTLWLVVKEAQAGRLQPGFHLVDRLPGGGRLFPEPGLGDDPIEFHKAVMTDGPGRCGFRQGSHAGVGLRMETRFPLVGMDQDIGVNGDQWVLTTSRWPSMA